LKLAPNAIKSEYNKDWEALFSKYTTLSAKEFSELSGMPRKDSDIFLNHLASMGKLDILSTKNGNIWKAK
jgi:hypothetical protein